MLLRVRKAQSTLEYALLITVVIGGLIGAQSYIKRGVQDKLKQASDSMGEQWSPGITDATYVVTSSNNKTETFASGSGATIKHTESVTGSQNQTTDMDIKALSAESWPATYSSSSSNSSTN